MVKDQLNVVIEEEEDRDLTAGKVLGWHSGKWKNHVLGQGPGFRV